MQWKYYNHAMVPTTPPHMEVDVSALANGSVWHFRGGIILFARWTSDWDCGYKTEFWYVIKDTPFDVMNLKAKRRYEINKGKKNFEVLEISPLQFAEPMNEVALKVYNTYPKAYKPKINREELTQIIRSWSYYKVIGAFHKETGLLCGYAVLDKQGEDYINFLNLKADPDHERQGVNAAIVNYILEIHAQFLRSGGYICDGCRNLYHNTNFQDYLEKYFGFRKAYCKLHVEYRPSIKFVMKISYPIRKLLIRVDKENIFYNINSLTKMEMVSGR